MSSKAGHFPSTSYLGIWKHLKEFCSIASTSSDRLTNIISEMKDGVPEQPSSFNYITSQVGDSTLSSPPSPHFVLLGTFLWSHAQKEKRVETARTASSESQPVLPLAGRQPGSKSREGLLQLARHHELPAMLSQPTGQYWPAQRWGNLEQQIALTAIRYEAPQEALENPTDGRKKTPNCVPGFKAAQTAMKPLSA